MARTRTTQAFGSVTPPDEVETEPGGDTAADSSSPSEPPPAPPSEPIAAAPEDAPEAAAEDAAPSTPPETGGPAEPPGPGKARYRVWSHGTLQRNGKTYQPGDVLTLATEVGDAIVCLARL